MDLLRMKSDTDITDELGVFHLSFEKYRKRYTGSDSHDGYISHPLYLKAVWEDEIGKLSWTTNADIDAFPFEGEFASRAPLSEGEYGGKSTLKESNPRYQILTMKIRVYEE